jgi:CheY-like chemotaxis protein
MEIRRGSGLILVVDDEEIIRQTAQAILEECGYTVVLAHNGEEGVQVFKARHHEIKAVLLDMVMPKKSGKEAYLEMRAIDPDLKVLLSSGFKQDERVESVLDLGVRGFIQKPYSLDTLSRAIFAVIDNGSNAERLTI